MGPRRESTRLETKGKVMASFSKRTKCSGCGVITPARKPPRHAYDCSRMRAEILASERKAKQYNGWSNYETWCVNLWIDNEQALYEERRERVKEIIEDNTDTDDDAHTIDRDACVGEVAEWLKTWISDEIPETYFEDTVNKVMTGALGPYCDLLGAALGEVDWREIAAHDVDDMIAEGV